MTCSPLLGCLGILVLSCNALVADAVSRTSETAIRGTVIEGYVGASAFPSRTSEQSTVAALAQGEPPAAPVLPRHSALRPTIRLKSGETTNAGTASIVRISPSEEPMLLTCLHIFGESGGLAKDIPSNRLDTAVQEIGLSGIEGDARLARASGALISTGYIFSQGRGGDVAAFRLQSYQGATVLSLAAENPTPGQWVWVVGDEYASRPPAQRAFPLQVVSAESNGDLALVPHKKFDTRGFSGAPIVDAHMTVVGVYGGRRGIQPDGSYTSLWGVSAEGVRSHLARSKK